MLLGADAYERLKEAIVNLEFKPGEIVTVSELARRLGMSRTPVREALGRLERDYLVILVPNQGVQIRDLSLDDVINMLQLREVVDGLAARLAAGNMDVDRLAELERKFQVLRRDGNPPDMDDQADLSRELHEAIVHAAGNPYLESTWNQLSDVFRRSSRAAWRFWKQSYEKEDVSLRRYREHLEIIRSLRDGDSARAETVAREHIANSLRDVLAVAAGQYSYPTAHSELSEQLPSELEHADATRTTE